MRRRRPLFIPCSSERSDMASDSPDAIPVSAARAAPRPARWWFYPLAILIGLSPFLLVEMVIRVTGWGSRRDVEDPFVGFRSVEPLFVLDESGDRWVIPKSRQGYFREDSFAADKADNEFRIFCLGGSTVQGNPYSIETAFTSWLELSLAHADPARRWEVVNCGGISYASYRLTPILREVLTHRPDLIILLSGQNEFLEDREFDRFRNRNELLNASIAAATELHTFNVVRQFYDHLRQPKGSLDKTLLPTEVTALLDFQGGLESYTRDRTRWEGVIAQYSLNMRAMIDLCRAADVPILVINAPYNLADCPPFKSENDNQLTADQLAEFERLRAQASAAFRDSPPDWDAAAKYLRAAVEIDPLHAGNWYTLGEVHTALGNWTSAKEAFLAAKEQDICPLRILEPMRSAVAAIAKATNTPLVDAQALFEDHSPHALTGGRWFVDHVHPSIEGHKLLTDEILRQLVVMGIVDLPREWPAGRDAIYQQHFDNLPDLYFAKANERLWALRGWATTRRELDKTAPELAAP